METSVDQRTSRIPGFYDWPLAERVAHISLWANLDADEREVLGGTMGLGLSRADRMIENVIGVLALPPSWSSSWKCFKGIQ